MRPPLPPLIVQVLEDSPAAVAGIEIGDRLLQIQGVLPRDLIEYRFLVAEEELLTLDIARGEQKKRFRLYKDPDEDPGLAFDTALFDGLIQCNNGCAFCFIDQQPEGLRPTLYLKDDDYRLSFLYGSYLTLTNLPPQEWDRIRKLRLSPLFVSVHATEPELRSKMLKNPRGGLLLEQLAWFREHRLEINAQVVLCPGINDGVHLDRTLLDLAAFYPTVASVAVVPVGLTQYRPSEDELQIVTPALAETVIRQVTAHQKTFRRDLDTTFSWLADEWYLLTGSDLPSQRHYEDYPQLGNGVGSLRLFLSEFNKAAKKLPPALPQPLHLIWIVGQAVGKIFEPIAHRLNQVHNLHIDLVALKSDFWGERITVTGLLTGSDLLRGLHGRALGDGILLPELMLKNGDQEFLDSLTVAQLQAQLGVPIYVIPSYAGALVDWIRDRLVNPHVA